MFASLFVGTCACPFELLLHFSREAYSSDLISQPVQAGNAGASGYPGANQIASVGGQRPPLAQVQAQLLEGMRPETGYGYGAGQRQRHVAAWPAVQKTTTVRNEVNLKKPTLVVVPDPSDPSKLFVEFTFDASASCQIGVYYLAVETKAADGSPNGFSALHPNSLPHKESRSKGLAQTYRVPLTHPLDVSLYEETDLTWTPQRESQLSDTSFTRPRSMTETAARFPVIICLEAVSSQSGSAQSQTTFATLVRVAADGSDANTSERWAIKPIKQKIQVGSVSYELQEIYGIDQARTRHAWSTEGNAANGEDTSANEDDVCGGSECVICMSETKDTTVLPCRHMCMCSGCARVLRIQSNRCPICRQLIDSLLQIKVSKPAPDPGDGTAPSRGPASAPLAAVGDRSKLQLAAAAAVGASA